MQQCMYKTNICDICDLQKRLTQTWVDFEWNVMEAAIAVWDHDVHAGGGHFEHMLRNYWSFVSRGSSEHFVKLSM